MRAGRLTERITVQRKSVARDAIGGETITWLDVAVVWAEQLSAAGREFVALRQARAEVALGFRTRYFAGVNATMRVLWGGTPYEVVEVIAAARRSELRIYCRGEAQDA